VRAPRRSASRGASQVPTNAATPKASSTSPSRPAPSPNPNPVLAGSPRNNAPAAWLPKSSAPKKNPASIGRPSPPRRSSDRSTNGCLTRRSTAIHAASAARPPRIPPTVRPSVHPQVLPLPTAARRSTSPRLSSPAPAQSIRPRVRRVVSGTSNAATGTVTIMRTAGTHSVADRLRYWCVMPASSRPKLPPTARAPTSSPITRPARSSACSRTIANSNGRNAPSGPWTARPSRRIPNVGATATSTDPTATRPAAMIRSRRWP
jgi:hypothetical protein